MLSATSSAIYAPFAHAAELDMGKLALLGWPYVDRAPAPKPIIGRKDKDGGGVVWGEHEARIPGHGSGKDARSRSHPGERRPEEVDSHRRRAWL